jgi:ornithine cyclodeaminase
MAGDRGNTPTSASIPVIDEATLRAAVTPARAVAVMREAFKADGEGRTRVPPVINLELPAVRGEFHVKMAYVEGLPYVAVKVASGFYDNPKRGLPSGSGLMALFDASTGLPAALLADNGFLTDIRTAAAGALAADLLARQRIETVGVIGSGVQAREQIRCLATVRSFSQVIAWSPTRANLDRYARDMSALGFRIVPAAGPEEVCRSADVLITATPARRALVHADWLREGIHVTALGSDSPGKQELSPDCLARADLVVVDRLDQCAAFGELRHAIDAGLMEPGDVHAQLGEIAAGCKPGRTGDSEITIADLTGVGFQDTAIASAVFQSLS